MNSFFYRNHWYSFGLACNKKTMFFYLIQQQNIKHSYKGLFSANMDQMEIDAKQYLANIQDDNNNQFSFHPYSSILITKKQNREHSQHTKRPQSVRLQPALRIFDKGSLSKREALKHELKIMLEEPFMNEQSEDVKFIKKRAITTGNWHSTPTQCKAHHNIFPSHPIKRLSTTKKVPSYDSGKKMPSSYESVKKVPSYKIGKENDLKIQDLVRRDIKNKFSIRENLRQLHKMKKIQHFINIASELQQISKGKPVRRQIKPMRKNNLINLLT